MLNPERVTLRDLVGALVDWRPRAAYAALRRAGAPARDIVLLATFDETTGEPPAYSAVEVGQAAERLGVLTAPGHPPPPLLVDAFAAKWREKLAEAQRQGVTIGVAVRRDAVGVESTTVEGVMPSSCRGEA